MFETGAQKPSPYSLIGRGSLPDEQLVVVQADRGAGKTELLRRWHDDQQEQGRPVTWLDATDGEEPDYLGNHLERAFASEQPPAVMFVDDLHLLGTEASRAGLLELAVQDRLPTRVVVACRRNLSLPLAKLRADGVVTEINTSDLRFGSTEIDGLCVARNLDLTDAVRRRILELTEGWAEGVIGMLDEIARQPSMPAEDVVELVALQCGRLLADEIESAEPAWFDALVETSILESFGNRALSSVAGVSGLDLRQLVHRAPFTELLGRTGEAVRLHGLARLGLFLRLVDRDGLKAVADRHIAAGQFLESNDDFDRALSHYVAGGASDRAADVLARMWSVDTKTVSRSDVESLNSMGAADYTPQLVTVGMVHAREERYREVRKVLDLLAETTWEGPLPHGFAGLDAAIVELMGKLPDLTVKEMQHFLEVLLRDEVSADGPRELAARYTAAHQCYWLDRRDQARELLESVMLGHLSIGRQGLADQVVTVLASSLLAVIEHDHGNLDVAREHLAHGRELAVTYNLTDLAAINVPASHVSELSRAIVSDAPEETRIKTLEWLTEEGCSNPVRTHAAVELVRLLDRRRDFRSASEVLDRVDELVASWGVVPLLSARLDRLRTSMRSERTGAGPSMHITSGERAVLYLLADRSLSQTAISEQLSLSINTVKSHLRSIYQKFGSRDETRPSSERQSRTCW